ncbi:DUF6915 family protein [Sphingomonas oryzagri]
MNPYDHARSSARIHGGLPTDYQPVHDWFDLSKSTQCHFTHRALRHHHEGIAVAVEIFGPVIRNADGVDVATQTLGRQHVEEDCPSLVDAVDWLVDYDVPEWLPSTVPTVDELAERSARRFGGDAGTWRPLHAWFLETQSWVGDTRHLIFRHQSFGIFEAEARFGHAIASGTGTVPTRVIAEHHVRAVLGRIPAATDVLRRIRGARWMLQATSAERLGLGRPPLQPAAPSRFAA